MLRNNRNKPVTNYLLLILDENKKIRKGNIVQYLPENKATKSPIPINSFHNIYNKKPVTGQFTFLSITDVYQYELEYKSSFLNRFSKMMPKTGNFRTSVDCIDWFLITYWTNTDGTTYTTEEYVGRTCGGNGCTPSGPTDPETLDCGDGSATNYETTLLLEKPVNWVVGNNTGLTWHVQSYEKLFAQKTGSAAAIFTNIDHLTSTIYNTPAGPNDATWEQLSSSTTLISNNYVAKSIVSGKVTTSFGDYPLNNKQFMWYAEIEFP